MNLQNKISEALPFVDRDPECVTIMAVLALYSKGPIAICVWELSWSWKV